MRAPTPKHDKLLQVHHVLSHNRSLSDSPFSSEVSQIVAQIVTRTHHMLKVLVSLAIHTRNEDICMLQERVARN